MAKGKHMKLSFLQRLLLCYNPLFTHRYIRRNNEQLLNLIGFVVLYNEGGGDSQIARILRKILARFCRSFLKRVGKLYFKARVLFGFVDMPQLTLVLTTKCSLRCESCSNLMPYFNASSHFVTDIESIKQDIEALLAGISTLGSIHIIGGEPLLFKELPQVMHYLASKKQIKAIELITNATIPFSKDLLESLCYKKTRVIISDYSANVELKPILRQEVIIKSLQQKGVKYIFWHSNSAWRDIGTIYKRNRDEQDIVRNFIACDIPCVSLLCKDNTKESISTISVCAIASGLIKLRSTQEFEGDFVRLDSVQLSSDILRFYAQDFFKACDYCPNKWEESKPIPVALQTKKTLKLENPHC